jgi:hypothetical protein
MDEYKNMMKWLSTGTTGELVFDSDQYWGWTVVLDTVGDATFVKRARLIVVEFEITFKTIGTYLAHSIYPGTWIMPQPIYDRYLNKTGEEWNADSAYLDVIGSNGLHIPPVLAQISYGNDGKDYIVDFYLQDINNITQDFVFNFDLTNFVGFKIAQIKLKQKINNNTEIDYLNTTFSNNPDDVLSLKYNSKNSIFYINDNLAELNQNCTMSSQPNGLVKIESESPIQLYTTNITNSFTSIVVDLDEQSWEDFSYNDWDYVCVVQNDNNASLYGVDEYADYSFAAKSFIAFKTANIYTKYVSEMGWSQPEVILGAFSSKVPQLDNTCKVYYGKSHHFQVVLTFQKPVGSATPTLNIPFTIQVTSYNNL